MPPESDVDSNADLIAAIRALVERLDKLIERADRLLAPHPTDPRYKSY